MSDYLVFISHIREEVELAKILGEYLSSIPFLKEEEIFISAKSINAGARWFREIEDALRTAKITLVLCSRNSIGRPWINFESGASFTKEIPVVPICHSGLKFEDLSTPLDIYQAKQMNGYQASELAGIVRAIAVQIGASSIPSEAELEESYLYKKTVSQIEEFEENYAQREQATTVIEGLIERTKQLIHDLRGLSEAPQLEKHIWYSGFLSAFAISDQESFQYEAQKSVLLEEKECLLDLAQRGCSIKCIITPPNPAFAPAYKSDGALLRLDELLNFLKSDSKTVENIDWTISPYRLNNVYIIDHISCLEGSKKGVHRGYNLTLRQTDSDTIAGKISLYEALFDRLIGYTLGNFPLSREEYTRANGLNGILRMSVTKAIEESRDYVQST